MTTPFEIFRTPITLRSSVNGSYVNGLWQDGSSVLLGGNLVTGNIISMSLNGVPLANVDFLTDTPTTMAILQAEILLQPNIFDCTFTGLTLMIVPVIPFLAVIDYFDITGGASQPSVTVTQSPILSTITASIQPLSGEEMLELPEARREKEVYKMFTSTQVNTVTSENPDQVQFFGKVFEIYEVKPWQNTSVLWPVQNYCYYVMRLQPLAP